MKNLLGQSECSPSVRAEMLGLHTDSAWSVTQEPKPNWPLASPCGVRADYAESIWTPHGLRNNPCGLARNTWGTVKTSKFYMIVMSYWEWTGFWHADQFLLITPYTLPLLKSFSLYLQGIHGFAGLLKVRLCVVCVYLTSCVELVLFFFFFSFFILWCLMIFATQVGHSCPSKLQVNHIASCSRDYPKNIDLAITTLSQSLCSSFIFNNENLKEIMFLHSLHDEGLTLE